MPNPAKQAIDFALAELRSVLYAKNEAYGNSAFEPAGVLCKADAETLIRARADDKIRRIQNGDTSEDAILDLEGYLLLLRALPHYQRIMADIRAQTSPSC